MQTNQTLLASSEDNPVSYLWKLGTGGPISFEPPGKEWIMKWAQREGDKVVVFCEKK